LTNGGMIIKLQGDNKAAVDVFSMNKSIRESMSLEKK
jgi:hypothetical protein